MTQWQGDKYTEGNFLETTNNLNTFKQHGNLGESIMNEKKRFPLKNYFEVPYNVPVDESLLLITQHFLLFACANQIHILSN